MHGCKVSDEAGSPAVFEQQEIRSPTRLDRVEQSLILPIVDPVAKLSTCALEFVRFLAAFANEVSRLRVLRGWKEAGGVARKAAELTTNPTLSDDSGDLRLTVVSLAELKF